MANPGLSDALCKEALDAYENNGGNAAHAAHKLGLSRSTFMSRLRTARTRSTTAIFTDSAPVPDGWTFHREKTVHIADGPVIVFSDAHYWPTEATTAHRALVEVVKAIKPRMIVANGDIFDGVTTTRHDPFGWSKRPSTRHELEACQERLHEIELAAPRGCALEWNIGNHDQRFERTLCSKVPEFAGIHGFRLSDHFPNWSMQWSTLVNPDSHIPTIIKHRFAGGIHAGYNNTLRAGYHTVTGHTHILEVKPWGDYRGRRWGIQTGSLANLHGPAFEYHENAPSSACSGFAVLTFAGGELLPPELCEVIGETAYFRGKAVTNPVRERCGDYV